MSDHLPAVDPVTRALNYVSVSQLSRFDHTQFGSCGRRWFFRYVARRHEEKTRSQEIGIKVHEQIEHYLKYGQDCLGEIALEGKRLLPAPGGDLMVEFGLNGKPKPKKERPDDVEFYPPSEALVHADGVPLVGFIDIAHDRGTYVDVDGVLRQDPPNTVECGDNKTSSNISYAKPGADLIHTPQMAGYGEFLSILKPEVEHVRLSHLNFQTGDRRAASKTTALFSIREIKDAWETHGHAIVRQMKQVAVLENEADVPANLNSCNAFNKLCDHHAVCSAYKNATPASRLKLKLTQESKMSSLLSRVKAVTGAASPVPNGIFANAPVPVVPTPVAAAPVAAAPAPAIVQGFPPWVTPASAAVQGQQYQLPNGMIATFLCAYDSAGTMGYSFMPVAGGAPIALSANEPLQKPPGKLVGGLQDLSTPAAPPAPVPVTTFAPAPVAAAPAPVPAAPRAAPAPVAAAPIAAPPVAAAPAAPAPTAAAKRTGRGPGKKTLEAAAGGEDVVTDIQDAIEAAKVIFQAAFGGTPTPEQALPIWQALLAR